jgi:hypothetical protein
MRGGAFLFSKRHQKTSTKDLYKLDFKSSAQKIGLYFSETLRNKFRQKWLRLK